MRALLSLSAAIDRINEVVGKSVGWLVLASILVSATNAVVRKVFGVSSNGWLEIQWYMFGYVVLLGAANALRLNEHVRVDLVYGAVSDRGRLWIDTFGLLLFLLPFTLYAGWLSWPFFLTSFAQGEMSFNAGGLIRWPIKLSLSVGFWLLSLQGISELIKRIAALNGAIRIETAYEKPLQ